MERIRPTTITRRRALRDLGAGRPRASSGFDALLAPAAEAAPKHGTLADIEHVVILMQENRSFDHYFGTYSGVRGFGDQAQPPGASISPTSPARPSPVPAHQECLPDITHDWAPSTGPGTAGA